MDKEKYIVSRVPGQGDLILTDDTSISRIHAYLYPSKDHIKIIDCGSKYGTFINENILGNIEMKKNVPIELKNGDKIRFGGLKNMWIVDQMPFNVLTSTLSIADKELLINSLKIINGTVLETWTNDCTHITMSGIIVTLKLLQCMVAGLPIVTPQFWKKCIENLRANLDVPNHADFIPSTIEKYINDVSFDINLNRKRIFTGKTFVFMVYKHMAKYETIIKLANGDCYSLDQRKTRLNLLTKPNIIVVKYIPSAQSQSHNSITNLNEYLRKKNFRVIPDCEIGLAILYCSIQKFCNPEHKLIENIDKNICQIDTPTILADDTPLLINNGSNNINNTSMVVPETVQSSTDVTDNDTKIIEIIDDYKLNSIEEPTQQFIITPQKNDGKRKASPMNSDDSTIIKRVHLQESIGISGTSVSQQKDSRKSSEFLTKRNISNITEINSKIEEPPITTIKNVTSKRCYNLLDNDNSNDDELFAFGAETFPKKKSKLLTTNNRTVGDANNGNDDLLFSFENSSKICSQTNKNVQSVSLSKSDNVLQKATSNSKILRPQLLVKPIGINFDGWLSKTFKKELTINNENESDSIIIPKKDEDELNYDEVDSTKKWIEDIKDKFEIKIKVLNLIARTSINNSTEDAGQDNFGKIKNFKAFVKVITFFFILIIIN